MWNSAEDRFTTSEYTVHQHELRIAIQALQNNKNQQKQMESL